MNSHHPAPREGQITGFLFSAQRGLRELLVPESEALVTVLGHLEAAAEYTAEPNESDSVAYHCRQALRIVETIERRHDGDLAETITDCLNQVRRDVDHALRRIDMAAPPERLAGNRAV